MDVADYIHMKENTLLSPSDKPETSLFKHLSPNTG